MTAFEPVSENFEALGQNGALDQLANIELPHLAVSEKEGFRTLKITENSGQSGFYAQQIVKTEV
jgi:FkbM family methyltransferase